MIFGFRVRGFCSGFRFVTIFGLRLDIPRPLRGLGLSLSVHCLWSPQVD